VTEETGRYELMGQGKVLKFLHLCLPFAHILTEEQACFITKLLHASYLSRPRSADSMTVSSNFHKTLLRGLLIMKILDFETCTNWRTYREIVTVKTLRLLTFGHTMVTLYIGCSLCTHEQT
jgi:hypothetical protein